MVRLHESLNDVNFSIYLQPCMYVCFVAETDETSDLLSEELSETTLPLNQESSSVHSSSDGHRESVQYRTAEIADAMMSGSLLADHHVVLSVIPSDTKESHLSEADTGTCDAAAEGECSTNNMASVSQQVSHAQEPIVHPPVALEAVHPSLAEDSNNTDGMKTPKVNCEERNITGITNFTLQILNISQVSDKYSDEFLLKSSDNIGLV